MQQSKKTFNKPTLTKILFAFTLLNLGYELAQANKTEKADRIDQYIGRYADYGKFNGSILVADNGQVIYKKGFGMANMEWDIANQTDTKFRIASITKQFTAMLIMQLVAESKLELHKPISTYLPDYPKKNAERITIHHLLTHTSGTPMFDDFLNYRDIERDRYKPEELLNIFAHADLKFTPGEKYAYSNEGYNILGVIIEKISNKSYQQALQDKIFTPLKMHNSGYDVNHIILKKRASGYTKGYVRNQYFNVNYIDMSIPYSAGSIYSTVEDLFIWDQSLYTDILLPKKFRDLLFGKYIPAPRRHYGYGWFNGPMQIGTSNKEAEINIHGGGINGFRTLITRIPATKSTIIILSNLESAPVYEMTNSILGILNDKPYNPKISIAYTMVDLVEKHGIQEAHEYYQKVNDTYGYYTDVNEINIAAYGFLHADKIKEAEFLFKLNIQAFPDSFISYDSYGELLLMLGKKSQALENYKKSIELNANNRNALRILKELSEK